MNDIKLNKVKVSYKNEEKLSERLTMENITDSIKIFMQIFDEDTMDLKESVKVLFLNSANHVLSYMDLSEGGTLSAEIDVKLILQGALTDNASKIILCHNHPSGDVTPSIEDIKVTSKIKNACDMMNIQLLDHVIITSEHYFSFLKGGLM